MQKCVSSKRSLLSLFYIHNKVEDIPMQKCVSSKRSGETHLARRLGIHETMEVQDECGSVTRSEAILGILDTQVSVTHKRPQ